MTAPPAYDPSADDSDLSLPGAPRSGVEIAPGVSVPRDALRFAASRSGGPGGQNVNKRSTKVELRIFLADLPLIAPVAARLARLAGRRLLLGDAPGEAEIHIISDEHRTQGRNRDECLDRLRALIVQAQTVPKTRRKTKPTKGSKMRRLDAKRQTGEKKRRRSDSPGHDD